MELEAEFVVINEEPAIVQQLLYSVIETDKPQPEDNSADVGDGMSENDSDDDYKESVMENNTADSIVKVRKAEAHFDEDSEICVITLVPDNISVAQGHDVPASYCCHVCQRMLNSIKDLKSHEKNCHAQPQLLGPECNKGFQHQEDLDQHMNVHSGKRLFKCGLCDKSFVSKSSLTQHTKKNHVNLENRTVSNHCRICQKEFNSKKGLTFHEKNYHSDAHIFCPDCNKGFKLLSDLDRHMNVHSGNRPFKCDMCDKSFVSKSSLSQHKKLKHIVGDIYKCTICDKTFNTEFDAIRHSRVHTGIKPFKCDHCSKSFTCKSSLKTHQRVHDGKTLKCRFCKMSFYIESDRARHETTHTGVKPYKCELCGNSYSCKSTFTVHFKNAHSAAAAIKINAKKTPKKEKTEEKCIKDESKETTKHSEMNELDDVNTKVEDDI